MPIPQPTPEDSVLVALDLSKLRNDILIEIRGKARCIRLTVLNSRTEHNHFLERLARFDPPVIIGFEATESYHRRLAYRLIEAGFTPWLISWLALAGTREALHNCSDKNDPKDAQVILHMLRIGASQVYCDPLASGIDDLQELSKRRETISKAKTELLHRLLTHYLRSIFRDYLLFRQSEQRLILGLYGAVPNAGPHSDILEGSLHRCRLSRRLDPKSYLPGNSLLDLLRRR